MPAKALEEEEVDPVVKMAVMGEVQTGSDMFRQISAYQEPSGNRGESTAEGASITQGI